MIQTSYYNVIYFRFYLWYCMLSRCHKKFCVLYHSHKKRKDSLETQAILLIFSLELEISGVAVQGIHQSSQKWLLSVKIFLVAVAMDSALLSQLIRSQQIKKVITNPPSIINNSKKGRLLRYLRLSQETTEVIQKRERAITGP